MRDLAIRNTHPSVVSINAGVEAWDATGNVVALDETLIQAEIIRLQELYDSQEYARLRKAAYDQLNQFEMQFDDQANGGGTTWVDAVNSIKARYPK
jgi:hypothetical protein